MVESAPTLSGLTSFKAGVDFESILGVLSKQIYETPLAFIRENVQNAVDAVKLQAHRDGVGLRDDRYRIDVNVDGQKIIVRDRGIGMSEDDLRTLFWTIGASGKRTPEAQAAGCVGMFGIGGFANFGICDAVEVVSQMPNASIGTVTRLSKADIQQSGAGLPSVSCEASMAASPQGTIVTGHLSQPPNLPQLRAYIEDFVRFVPAAIYFDNTMISQNEFTSIEGKENLTAIGEGVQECCQGDLVIRARFYEDRGKTIVASIEGLTHAGKTVNMVGYLRFENGPLHVYKRGFKLCATQIPTIIGVSGRLDCDQFVPTAGRDTLDAPTTGLLNRIGLILERAAIDRILASSDRIAENARIFLYIIQHGLFGNLDNVRVRLADASEGILGDIKRKAGTGVGIFYGVAQKQALNQIMHAQGQVVVILASERHRRQAEQQYLEAYCRAKPFDGVVDCAEPYNNLSRFELVFLSELEFAITKAYEVKKFCLVAGKLTENIPVFVKEHEASQGVEVLVDVRHPEIKKLEALGYSPLLYSLISNFSREYLGPSLKKWSPRFFGDGAINLELYASRKSDLWVLLKDDIGVVRRRGQPEVVSRASVQVVNVGATGTPQEPQPGKPHPRILQIIDDTGTTELAGYYIRLPERAFNAYGDLLPECMNRGVTWIGNRITYIASDGAGAAFQYEIRLDVIVSTNVNGAISVAGAEPIDTPVQEMFGGLYFPIPQALEPYLVPRGENEICLELYCEWMDLRTSRHWTPKEATPAG